MGKAPFPHNKRNCYPPYPDHYLKRYIFPLNSIRSNFNGGLSFVLFSIVEGNVNIVCGITKSYELIISLFSIKKKLFEQDFIFVNDLLSELGTINS